MNEEQAEALTVPATKSLSAVTAYRLAQFADCGEPDNANSAGANLLTSVRDSVVDLLDELDVDDVERIVNDPSDVGWIDDNGRIHEIADGAPDVYTFTRWAEFVDLAAYNEDPTELGDGDGDLTKTAGVCLYIIAERLVWSLLNTAAAAIAEAAAELDETEGDE